MELGWRRSSLAVSVTCAFLILVLAAQQGQAIRCWECNSVHDPRCADPFDSHTIEMADCDQIERPHLQGINATMCRKITQKVENKIRVIRTCGWLTSDPGEAACAYRTGTHEIYVTTCTCSGSDGCNGASGFSLSIPALILALGAAIKAGLVPSALF